MIRLTLLTAVGCLVGFEDPTPPPDPKASYEQMKAVAGRDAASQVSLALWCEAHGLERERLRHLAVAVLSDPSNAMARGLMGLVEYRGKWRRPEAVADAVKADVKQADLLAEYNGHRVRTPVKPDAQYKLALWCEERGLKDEARAHLATVVRLDPNHAAAWKKLGYKKAGRRWMTDEQDAAERAEAEAMKGAERRWKPLLAKWRADLKSPRKRPEVERALAEVTDPRAVPWIWSSLATGEAGFQMIAVQVLGQIDAISASRALAMLALSGKSPEVRRRAVETLRRRDPREFAGLLVALLRDPIKYEVRPVGGPGSPGALFVEGKQFNVRRLYAPPAMPNMTPAGGYLLGYDNAGYLVAYQQTPAFGFSHTVSGVQRVADPAHFHPTDQASAQAFQKFEQNAPAIMRNFWASHPITSELYRHDRPAFNQVFGFGLSTTTTTTGLWDEEIQIPVGRVQAEYQKSAVVAQNQLGSDVAALDRFNADVKEGNDQVEALLADVSGKDLKDDREGWRKWWKNLQGYAYYATTDEPKPTVVENVPLAYQPQAMPTVVTTQTVGSVTTTVTDVSYGPTSKVSCFGAGTPVRTISGPRPIESLLVGDLVLAQDVKTGKLGYRPVTVVHHNPPSPTYVIRLDGDTIVSSHFHRFWVAGRGWVMARDLKEGDPIRTLGGVTKVTKIEPGKVQLVYNLDVEGDADFFAGASAALVHDNTLPDLKQQPFDAPQAFAVK